MNSSNTINASGLRQLLCYRATPSPTALRSPLSPEGARESKLRLPFTGKGGQVRAKTNDSSSLSPLGERGDRKAVGEPAT